MIESGAVVVWLAASSVIAPSAAPSVPFESSFAPSPSVIDGAERVIFPPAASTTRPFDTVMLSASLKT